MYHIPVLLHESVDGLSICPDGTYVDVTFGGGGHSREILSRLGPNGHLYSFDRSNFRYLKNWMRYYGVDHVDGLIADLGVSSHHFDAEERGFSFRFDAPLDMRMNGRAGMTAADVVNRYTEEQLANVFYLYGEMKNSRRLAAAIAKARGLNAISTIDDLLQIVRPLMPREREKKDLARVFQALRIEVNHEMDALHEMLDAAQQVIRPGGRLVVLTYHSLEDRMVKNFIKAGNIEGEIYRDIYGKADIPLSAVNRKPILPQEEEIAGNTRARSAKLRVAEKL